MGRSCGSVLTAALLFVNAEPKSSITQKRKEPNRIVAIIDWTRVFGVLVLLAILQLHWIYIERVRTCFFFFFFFGINASGL